ncbi:MAG: lysylphosphatidylglycerol synthase domain-containing protein [Emticicia sp.]
MQINSKFSNLTSSRVLWWIKTIVFLTVIFLLYRLIQSKIEHFDEVQQSFSLLFLPKNIFLLTIIILLTPVNWAFEAWKWQKLASKVEEINFWEAYKGVLIGLTFSTATPMMIGDYAGKILMLKTDKRLESIGAILLGNSLQMYVSLLFGTISYLFFVIWANPSPLFLHISIVVFLTICLVFGIFLSFNLSNINAFLSKNQFFEYLKKYLGVLENYKLSELKILFVIATSRYFVFSLQFVLMFKAFQINLPISVLLVGVGIIFLTKTLISVLNALGDLSIRELTSIYYFGFFGANIAAVSSATFMIWLVNILFPILIGSVFILQLKLTSKNT